MVEITQLCIWQLLCYLTLTVASAWSAHRHGGLVVLLGELGLHVLAHGLAPSDHHLDLHLCGVMLLAVGSPPRWLTLAAFIPAPLI